jgi:hypothetical protein
MSRQRAVHSSPGQPPLAPVPGQMGKLGLTENDVRAIVVYMGAMTDQ